MSHRSAKDMATPRMKDTAVGSRTDQSPIVNKQTTAADGARVPIKIPAGGEAHLRSLKGGGVLVSTRDANYNTVAETYAEDPAAIDVSSDGV